MKSKLIIINSCVILVLGLFSIDLYNPALPIIKSALAITNNQAQSLVVYYLSGFAVSQLFYGPLSDKYGRIPIIVFSLLFSAVGNYLTSAAESFHTLSLFRLLTGIGAGGCPVISRAILSDTFRDKTELSKSLTIFSMASQVSPAFAPVIGGYITEYLPWRFNFIALAIMMLVGVSFVKMTLPETSPMKPTDSGRITGFRILLSDVNFVVYSVVSAVLFAITIGYFTASPFVFQTQFDLSSSQNGYLFMIYSAGIVIGSLLTKKWLSHSSPEKILRVSLPLLLFFTAIALISVHFIQILSIAFIVIYSFSVGMGCGLSSPLLLGISLYGHPELSGTGSALQGALKMAGAAIVLYFFSRGHTATAAGLMWGLFILTLICVVLIAFTQYKAPK
ncbi:Bcr/CflA family efflux MFS transporter [Xenorhabdus bovienii]|uniref:Bcr/CflA family efflux MFS transporter n=1 Tax=Xenorhabdus bovienii TaxID=40576 RepID=UPI0023B2AD39|nr:Bcr/CflA family efflux MFS transporter [Xenorhabdus bovienii]MDE9454121.1 Bcr/CflA family efflux MFS transporter [Xenorhabdus bovienii]MDE9480556.1 Bcr/CflA family efflux MFS transporter [Xenorhabdus bovienii]MDE9543522.1 Bcr/CflA family efflux MFS transporter [Xenorhabdus bovienii]MDE9551952.1 Bcr/CflA family efflux MFS transporter [Xenorhabdus bovienii]MDE9556326.1 Bcr/CflA family efflux MFS transporter [Xenorhabdus bovienii]